MTIGRPTKYTKDLPELATNYCLLGATDEELAGFFDVALSTLNKWKKDHPEFSEAIKEGKSVADGKVAQSLYNRALGYSHPDTKFATHEGKITDSQEYTKHYAPDPTSAIFWLKNRQKDKWRDKTHQDVNVKTKIEDLTDEQLDELIASKSK
jgi:hypothetical protein